MEKGSWCCVCPIADSEPRNHDWVLSVISRYPGWRLFLVPTFSNNCSLPLIIIGAPRSGTNMLRDVICGLPGVVTWPCDEINLIWRHGNVAESSDALTREQASPTVKRYIRECFERLGSRQGARFVLEKTCANSLRVGFVDEVLPEARFIFIVRHGIDAAMSAVKRWHAPLDLPYTLRKLRYVPATDVPRYGAQFLRNRVAKLLSGENRLSSWGPRFPGMDEAVDHKPIAEVCAMQWQQCVERAEHDLAQLAPERVFRLKYEDFVTDPSSHLRRISDFLGIVAERLPDTSGVRQDLVGKGRKETDPEIESHLRTLLAETLHRYGYE